MATLIPSYSTCLRRMTSGEKRFAQRLEAFLEADYTCWYDVPIGTKYQHPDFVILHPRRGVLVLEVKDWRVDTIQRINPVSVSLLTDRGIVESLNPILQARQNAFAVKNILERDPLLVAAHDHPHRGSLICPYGFGVVLAGITRAQFEETDLGEVLPPHLICKDEMTESVDPERFQERLWSMFNVKFPHLLTLPQIQRIRWHLFPELRISQGSLFPSTAQDHPKEVDDPLFRVMDLAQEQLARSLGEGHRVIHGVAGSGKTLILGYRCEELAKAQTTPILVLCYNIVLAAKLEQSMALRGLGDRVSVRHFHRWCLEQLTLYHIAKPDGYGEQFLSQLVTQVQHAVERGQIPRGQYGAILVDEGHDFDADWLSLISQMVNPQSNSLLLLYDDAQSIYGKKRPAGFSFKRLGIQAQGRTTILRVNYRNTDDIQRCAYKFATEILSPTTADEDGVPLVKPEMAGRSGPQPRIVRLSSLESEADFIAAQLVERHARGIQWNQMAVLYKAKFVAKELVAALAAHGIPFTWMKDRVSKRFDPSTDRVAVMTLHSSKGLEFQIVAIGGLGFMPYRESEAQDDARLLYVGMTRATEELLMTASRDSEFAQRLLTSAEAA